jgi:hypothetical protein
MLHGSFPGNSSTADGLKACYMGNNKYLFFAITNLNKELMAYVIDMNANNGEGDRIKDVTIESNINSEAIELIAKAGTTNQYWLIYCYNNSEIRVRSVDVSNPENPLIGSTYSFISKTDSYTYSVAVSPQQNRIALVNQTAGSVDVFNFNNSTGALTLRHNIGVISYGNQLYSVEFSPDGNQLYCGEYRILNAQLHQYDISASNTYTLIESINYWTSTYSNDDKGGGLKLGPDNRIYVTLSFTDKVGIISDPNNGTVGSLTSRYNRDGLSLAVTYSGLQFSTGLTKPAIMSCNMNNPPTTQADSTVLCITPTSQTAKVNVIANDSDADNNTIFLTSAEFVNSADATLADITVNAADSTITLTLKSGAYISAEGYMFNIIYNIKDNGLPASQCATGLLKVTAYPTPNYPDIRVRACPDAGNVKLAKYIDTLDNVTDIQWASQISGIPISSSDGTVSTVSLSPFGVYTFTYTVSSRCVSDQKRKVYLEVLKNGKVRLPKDTVAVCYLRAEAVNINQIFGIEAGGDWEYHSLTSDNIDSYVTLSTSSVYGGAVVMNGKGIFEDASVTLSTYHGVAAKMVKFIYKTDSDICLKGKEYEVVIVLTEDIIN